MITTVPTTHDYSWGSKASSSQTTGIYSQEALIQVFRAVKTAIQLKSCFQAHPIIFPFIEAHPIFLVIHQAQPSSTSLQYVTVYSDDCLYEASNFHTAHQPRKIKEKEVLLHYGVVRCNNNNKRCETNCLLQKHDIGIN